MCGRAELASGLSADDRYKVLAPAALVLLDVGKILPGRFWVRPNLGWFPRRQGRFVRFGASQRRCSIGDGPGRLVWLRRDVGEERPSAHARKEVSWSLRATAGAVA